MKITRKFTTAGQDPFSTVEWSTRSSRISNPDGSVVFEMQDAEIPSSWSQLATDIMVSKYFRKAGVPQVGADGKPVLDTHGKPVTGPEKSARQVIHRLAGCWRHWGETHGYFDSEADAQAFYDELAYMMVHQMAAPNSPQWFNTGLQWAYGITGPAQGHYIADHETGEVRLADDAYSHPQPHACFIQSVADDLVNDGGIMDLWVREARLFKYGSGTGTNFSHLRGENEALAGGGKSSGLMSWLKIGDRAAGAIKSGGTTRRAAKMVCLDLDHPDIDKFVNWKVREEIKVAAMVEGLKVLKKHDESIKVAAERMGLELTFDFNGEAYATVSGQNSNNSVRIPDAFFHAVDKGANWELTFRTTGEIARTVDARELWKDICYAAWRCADPGVQYDTTINAWHTCPASGRINASNPCSEYMFLDNTACNLASINVLKFYDAKTRAFDVERYEHAIDLWTTVLEISVLMAAFPSREIARLSWDFRTLGLGYANLGAMLMQAGVPYDSEEGRAICAMLTSILTGRSYRQSALLAEAQGPFNGYSANREHMLRVMRNHRRAAHGVARSAKGKDAYEALPVPPVPIDHAVARRANLANSADLLARATRAWDEAVALGEKHGYRNAQVSVIAPTGTIGLLMDCDTTGVEPDFALVKFKKLAGGGYFKIANASVRPALAALGYAEDEIRDILRHVLGALSLDVPMPGKAGSFEAYLRDRGLIDEDIAKITAALPGVFELPFAFNIWTLGDAAVERLGFNAGEVKANPSFNLLKAIGLTSSQIDDLNRVICGTQTIEGAPHIKDAHLPVFDCANRCGKTGTRFIAPEGHIRMMAAAQPFISGAISKTINLPNEATEADIAAAYRLSWELGLKANALYRDGCKLSQPLSSKSDSSADDAEHADEAGGGVAEAELRVLTAEECEDSLDDALAETAQETANLIEAAERGDRAQVEVVRERIVHRPMRRRLPNTRCSVTHKFNIAGHEGYLTVGLYEDGMPGELFITMAKEGSTIGGLMDSLGTAVSVALQYGVPVESLVNKFAHQRFEPGGMTTNADIPFAKSLVDYIFRWMGMEFLPGFREANAPKRGGQQDAPAEEAAERVREVEPKQRATNGASSARRPQRQAAHQSQGERIIIVEEHSSTVVLSEAMRDCQGDAPACDVCGTITVRNGACYKCLNCGQSMGCS
jgi:ribonucleoside-diphosphate reductase alpha chain